MQKKLNQKCSVCDDLTLCFDGNNSTSPELA
jgi:hypothetical protein